MMSSHSIYSQPSPEPRIALPLSPPATALLPSSETLRGELVKYSLLRILRFLPRHLASNQLSDLRDFITPIVPNNLSLQHYMPSGLVLRHFHQVIDELKGLYVPNDTENKLPKPRTGFSVFMSIFSRHMWYLHPAFHVGVRCTNCTRISSLNFNLRRYSDGQSHDLAHQNDPRTIHRNGCYAFLPGIKRRIACHKPAEPCKQVRSPSDQKAESCLGYQNVGMGKVLNKETRRLPSGPKVGLPVLMSKKISHMSKLLMDSVCGTIEKFMMRHSGTCVHCDLKV